MSTRNLAIMFTDIKGFTARTSESTREGMVQLLAEHDRLLTPVFKRFRGTVIKTIGDAFLVSFESPTDAVLCGMTVQEVLRQYNATAPERDRLDVRVAINVGDVEIVKGEHGNDVFGEAVNLAARLEGIAEAGEVTFTEAVFLTMNRSEVPTAEIGEHTFKGIPKAVKVYRVVYDPNSEQSRHIAETVRMTPAGPKFDGDGPSISMSRRPKARRSPYLPFATVLVVAVVATVAYAMSPGRRDAAAAAKAEALIDQGKLDEALAACAPRLEGREPAPPDLLRLQTRARLRKQLRADKSNLQRFHEIAREQLARSKGPEVPWEVVTELQPEYVMVTWVYFAGLAYERGQPPTKEVLESALAALGNYGPDDGGMADIRTLALRYHEKEAVEWASSAITGTDAKAFLGAQKLLEEHGDARALDPHVVDLRDVMTGLRKEAKERLFGEPPEKRAHAKALLENALENLGFWRTTKQEVESVAAAL